MDCLEEAPHTPHKRTRSFDFSGYTPLKGSSKKKKRTRCTSLSSPAELGRIMSDRKKSEILPERRANEYIRKKRAERKAEKKKKLQKQNRMRDAQERSNKLSKYMSKYGHRIRNSTDVIESIKDRMGVWIESEIERQEIKKEDEAAERIKNWYFKTRPVYNEFQKHWRKKRGKMETTSSSNDYSSSSGSDISSHDPFESLSPPNKRFGRVGDIFKKNSQNRNSDSESDYESSDDDDVIPSSTQKESESLNNSLCSFKDDSDLDDSNFTEEMLKKMGLDQNGNMLPLDPSKKLSFCDDSQKDDCDDDMDISFSELHVSDVIQNEEKKCNKEDEALSEENKNEELDVLNITPCTIPSTLLVGGEVLETPGIASKLEEELLFAAKLEERTRKKSRKEERPEVKKLVKLPKLEGGKETKKKTKRRIVTTTTTVTESNGECCTIL